MKNNNLQIGDLISLEGLEKPQEGVWKWELGGKKVNQLGEKMSDFAGKIEEQNGIHVGEVMGLVEGLRKALVKEISPEKSAKLLTTLRARFENTENMKNRHPGMEWEKVQAKLEINSKKLWSLHQMEDTGGEPDVVDFDEKIGEYIFYDCSAESPEGRRNCAYDRDGEENLIEAEKCAGNAISRAALMGIEILTEKEYRYLQTKGEFDKNSWSWLKTSIDKRKDGWARCGDRAGPDVHVDVNGPGICDADAAFRGSLRV